ncbi:amino acid adenylation domain-containing protein, partial [Virgibacillus salarius]|uniref:amino acid adenylation domain-containing protein n=1 Tax=Virgibacillus salarius TaxID=447199 RepID=UPI0031DAFC8C
LTANGKVDRRSLPEVTNQDLIQGEYKAPENKEEEKLVKIWQEVLGINEIGTEDNFFELGGNSLKASLVMNKVHKELGKDLPLKIFFEHATIRSIARYIRRSGTKVYEQIEKVDMKEYYQTSSVQKRMYTLQQFEKDSIAYNMPAVYELDGTINKERLNKTFKKLFNRHESLRTSFQMIDGEVVQKINDDIAFNLNFIKKSNIYLETIINDLIQPFDLEEAPLFRGMLLENGEKSYLFIDLHHIIADGISMNILIKDFIRLYNGSNLSPLQIQYKDFAEWHNKILKSNEIKQQENYWKGQFRGHLPVLNLPYDFERPQVKSFEGNQISFSLDKQRMNILKKISNQSDSTLFMVILSSFYILLAKYSEQEDIIVGTTTAGRLHANLEDVMGMFVNTIALRNRPEREKAFKDFLMEVKANSVAAFENQTYQFEALLESENIEKDISRNPLFDVMFSMNNQETDAIENLMLDGFVMEPLKINAGITKFDLSLAVTEREAGLTCSFEYCTKLFKQETIEKMINHFKEIVKCICENPNMKISDMEMISPAEKEKILTDVNNTKTNYPKNKSYVMLLEKKITENANGIAAVYKDKQITYGELNQKANALAQVLRNEGIQDNSIIPIMVDRSIEMLIGILGILKAGAAFMPIDTKFPKERINYMLEDIKASLFLTVKGSDIPTSVNPIYLDDERVYCNVDLDFQVAYSPDKLAYVMYTSGSTGKPKGVQITQRSIVNLCMWFGKQYGLYQNKNVLQNTSISFDVSVEEIFPTLLYGGTLFITTEKESLSREHFRDFIRRNKINIVQLVPTMMREFIAGGEKLESIQVLISGGEALPQALQAEIMDIGYNLYNCYGPTEYTVDAITTKCVESENVVIGKPIANTNAYILDRDGHLQPIGLPGELCIGGDGLALGYLNRPELTSEKFVENPFIQGGKIYKTGDRAKLLSDGTIEFLGRIDNQVKIRGVRVELGEIEERIQEHPEVKEAVVIAKVNHHDHYLVAYIIGSIASLEIKQYLKKTLPYNMVPTHIMKLEELPLTNNGKVNRNALPEPNLEMMSQVERAQPKTKLQKNLMDIWSNVLNKEIYSIYVNFFEIGGHSLKAIIVSNEIEKNINVAVSIIDIFKYPSIQELSDFLEGKQEKRYEMIPVCEEREYYETSSAQKR